MYLMEPTELVTLLFRTNHVSIFVQMVGAFRNLLVWLAVKNAVEKTSAIDSGRHGVNVLV